GLVRLPRFRPLQRGRSAVFLGRYRGGRGSFAPFRRRAERAAIFPILDERATPTAHRPTRCRRCSLPPLARKMEACEPMVTVIFARHCRWVSAPSPPFSRPFS